MPKLFIALDLPPVAAAPLAAMTLPELPGVRRTPKERLHLSLHFLGDADTAAAPAALRSVEASGFMLKLRGAGSFSSADGSAALWIGAKPNAALLGLHGAIGAALQRRGFVVERRGFQPHVTVARCSADDASGATATFLAEHREFSLPPVPIIGFGLYASAATPDGPDYRRVAWFPLAAPDHSAADY